MAAIARASISARLGIGLSIGDFIALAEQDPRIEGIWLRLFTIFMEELAIGAGIRASAAFSAMAFARLSITGRLVEDPAMQAPPGFTIAGEWGVGLKGGTSWQLFAHLGFKDTRRLIRRMVDAVVDEAVYQIGEQYHDQSSRNLLGELRAPAKIALRSAFELGLSIAESSPTFADSGPELAKRCVQVALEELQRFILEKLTELAVELFKQGLVAIGLDAGAWDRSEPQRRAFAQKLRDFPDEPFEPNVQNALYWGELIESGLSVSFELGDEVISDDCIEPLAVVWAATQLLFSSVRQLTDGSVRASVLGAISISAATPSFQGPLAVDSPPPTKIRDFIAHAVSAPAGIPLNQDHLVDFLLRDQLLDALVRQNPDLKPALEIVAGPDSGALVAAAQTIMRNIGSFAPDPNSGLPDAEASLRALSLGLRRYLDVRVQNELAPLVRDQLGDQAVLKLYFDEVLVESFDFVTGTVFDRVLTWSFGNIGYRDAIREACSSILMKFLGRSAVVSADILMYHAMQHVSAELIELAQTVDEPDGLGTRLAYEIDQDPEFVSELIEETLLIAADVFRPLDDAKRNRIRHVLYNLLDPMPPGSGTGWVDQLQQDAFIPDEQTRSDLNGLAEELAWSLADIMVEFFTRVLLRIGEKVADEIREQVNEYIEEVADWLKGLQDLIQQLFDRLMELPGEILALAKSAVDHFSAAYEDLEALLMSVDSSAVRTVFATDIQNHLINLAMLPLENDIAYSLLPGTVRQKVRNRLRSTVETLVTDNVVNVVLDDILSPLVNQSQEVSADLKALLTELRLVNADDNAIHQIADILLDYFEDEIRATIGDSMAITIAFDTTYTFKPPKVPTGGYFDSRGNWITTYYQPPAVAQTVSFDLGTFEISSDRVVGAVRTAIGGAAFFEDRIHGIASKLVAGLVAEDELAAAEFELGLVKSQHTSATQRIEESHLSHVDIAIIEPSTSSLYTHDLDLEVLLAGVPESFIGRGELVPQRIFVFLNQQPLDLSGFTVDRHRPNANLSKPDQLFDRETKTDAWGNAVSSQAESKDRDSEQTPRDFFFRGQSLKTSTKRATQRRQTAAAKRGSSEERARQLHQRNSMKYNRLQKKTIPDAQPNQPKNSFAPIPLRDVGRKLSDEQRRQVRDSVDSGIRLSLRIPLGELRHGINTLTVCVFDGYQQRYEQTTTFVAAPPDTDSDSPMLKIPPRIEIDIYRLPDTIRSLMNLQADNGTAANPSALGNLPKKDGDPLWIPPRERRRQSLSRHWSGERKRIQAVNGRIKEYHRLVSGKALRPELPKRDIARPVTKS
ncbi:MAG: hypothetical protein P8X96_25020 [Desulfobacteraceae bacterium]